MEILGYRVEWEGSAPEVYPVEDYRNRPPQFGDDVIALVAAVDAHAEAEQLRARVAELEAERAELEETAAANWNHCQEVDNYLIELLGEDFPTNSEESAENTKAAIRKLMANTAAFTIDAAREGE